MAYDQTPGAGSVYRLDPDRSVHVVLEGVTVSNGLEDAAIQQDIGCALRENDPAVLFTGVAMDGAHQLPFG